MLTFFVAIGIMTIVLGVTYVYNKSAETQETETSQEVNNSISKVCEKAVGKELERLSEDYLVYEQIAPKDSSDEVVEYVIVSKYGIYILSPQNWFGEVYAKEDYDRWVRYKKDGSKIMFTSPIVKNEDMIKELLGILPKSAERSIHSLVVIPDTCTLKYGRIPGIANVENVVSGITSDRNVVFTSREVALMKDIFDRRRTHSRIQEQMKGFKLNIGGV